MSGLLKQTSSAHGNALIEWVLAALAMLLLATAAFELTEWHTTRQRLALISQRAVDAASLSGGHPKSLQKHLSAARGRLFKWPIQACVVDPISALMQDFRDRHLTLDGLPRIRYNHIAQQERDAHAKGWASGRGPASGKTISEANQFNVVVVARYTPSLPWVRHWIGTVLIQVRHQAVMQSHRVSFTNPCVEVPGFR
jgi:hypothetical protein